jgi:hypothetical protein
MCLFVGLDTRRRECLADRFPMKRVRPFLCLAGRFYFHFELPEAELETQVVEHPHRPLSYCCPRVKEIICTAIHDRLFLSDSDHVRPILVVFACSVELDSSCPGKTVGCLLFRYGETWMGGDVGHELHGFAQVSLCVLESST